MICTNCNHDIISHTKDTIPVGYKHKVKVLTPCIEFAEDGFLCGCQAPNTGPVIVPTGTTTNTLNNVSELTRHDSTDKSGIDQIPPFILFMIGDVFKYGEKKYARDNWKKGTKWTEFLGSSLRHICKFSMGEWIDPESGLPHLSHAVVNCIFLIYYHERKLGEDDRDILHVLGTGLGTHNETEFKGRL